MKEVEETTFMNGRLGSSIKLVLNTRTRVIDTSYEIVVSMLAKRVKEIDSTVKLEKEKLTLQLKVGDRIVYKEPIVLDFTSKDELDLLYFKDLYNISVDTNINISATIIVSNNNSKYLDDTLIDCNIFLKALKDEILFIDLVGEEKDTYTQCRFVTSIEPELVEYKVNQLNWIKLNDNYFKVNKSDNKQYIQVRGKFKNKYSYSNVLKIYK